MEVAASSFAALRGGLVLGFRPAAGLFRRCQGLAQALLGLSPGQVFAECGCLAPMTVGFGLLAALELAGLRGPFAEWLRHGARVALRSTPGQAVWRMPAGSGRGTARGSPGRSFVDDAGEQARVTGGATGLHQALQPGSQLGHL
jgi:hypothetical protein